MACRKCYELDRSCSQSCFRRGLDRTPLPMWRVVKKRLEISLFLTECRTRAGTALRGMHFLTKCARRAGYQFIAGRASTTTQIVALRVTRLPAI